MYQGTTLLPIKIEDSQIKVQFTDTIPLKAALKINNEEFCTYTVDTIIDAVNHIYLLNIIREEPINWGRNSDISIEAPLGDYYMELIDPAFTDWEYIGFGFSSQSLMLTNSTDSDIAISFDGVRVHGKLRAGSAYVFDNRIREYLYVKGSGTGTVDIFAWSN